MVIGIGSSGGNISQHFGDCFITVVVCGHYGKADDCKELAILRGYRDDWLRAQKNGEHLTSEYYRIGPALATALENSP